MRIEADLEIFGKKSILIQAIMNLVDNAVDAIVEREEEATEKNWIGVIAVSYTHLIWAWRNTRSWAAQSCAMSRRIWDKAGVIRVWYIGSKVHRKGAAKQGDGGGDR